MKQAADVELHWLGGVEQASREHSVPNYLGIGEKTDISVNG
jgi:hypothetical protein